MRVAGRVWTLTVAAAIAFAHVPAAAAAASPRASFADLAALGLAAPVVVRATAIRDERLNPRDAAGLAPGMARFLVTATTTTAIAAPGDVPPRLTYLIDRPLDARGKPPKPAVRDVLLFLRPGTDAGQYALIDAHGEVPWTASAEAAVHNVLADNRRGTVPVVTGIASAFRVPGAVPGEAESQFFLSTRERQAGVARRPDPPGRGAAAVGRARRRHRRCRGRRCRRRRCCGTASPAPCRAALPPGLGAAADVAGDYRFVRDSLGPCGRTF